MAERDKKLEIENNELEKYGRKLKPLEEWLLDIQLNGKTLEDCKAEDDLLYVKNTKLLREKRTEYINSLEPPTNRLNIYIFGEGGTGKSVISRALARSIFENENCFFMVGNSTNVTFEGYDGEPALIWDEFRLENFLKTLGRSSLFNIFNPHPTDQKQREHVKYGSIQLSNQVNILNCVGSHTAFWDGLAGEYTTKYGNLCKAEDKVQSYRRFPIIINVKQNSVEALINKGFTNSGSYLEYQSFFKEEFNISEILNLSGGNGIEAQSAFDAFFKPIVDKCKELLTAKALNKDETEEEIKNYIKKIEARRAPCYEVPTIKQISLINNNYIAKADENSDICENILKAKELIKVMKANADKFSEKKPSEKEEVAENEVRISYFDRLYKPYKY